jgi:AcrR family transcriptional regulator
MESIADAALAGGLKAASIRDVAQRLGVTEMAVYRLVPNRDALLTLAMERATGVAHLPAPDSLSWNEWLTAVARNIQEVLEAYPGLADHVIRRPDTPLPAVMQHRRALEVLVSHFDFPVPEAEFLLEALGAIVVAHVARAQNLEGIPRSPEVEFLRPGNPTSAEQLAYAVETLLLGASVRHARSRSSVIPTAWRSNL